MALMADTRSVRTSALIQKLAIVIDRHSFEIFGYASFGRPRGIVINLCISKFLIIIYSSLVVIWKYV